MAYPQTDFSLTVLMNQRTQEYLHQAELDRLAKELRSPGTHSFSRRARQAVSSLGHVLTHLGEQLRSLEQIPGAS